jgi:hypothetical protein
LPQNSFGNFLGELTIKTTFASFLLLLLLSSELAKTAPQKDIESVLNPEKDFPPIRTVNGTTTAIPVGHPDATPEFILNVTAHCKELFTNTGCEKYVDPSPYIFSCMNDAVMMGNEDFIESHKRSYLRTCQSFIGTQDKDDLIAVHLGFDDNPCVGGCGNGTCTDLGCLCPTGLSGQKCELHFNITLEISVDWSKVTPEDNAASKMLNDVLQGNPTAKAILNDTYDTVSILAAEKAYNDQAKLVVSSSNKMTSLALAVSVPLLILSQLVNP